jgi:outer membrane lipoprotein-sorting protein
MRIPHAAAMMFTAAACWLAQTPALATVGGSGDTVPPAPTAEQIVDKCVEVRGGLAAWQKIATIIWAGHLESDRSPVPSLPFRLEEKRPGKSRFEVTEPSERSVRVFDGMSGWKMRPGQDGRPEVKRFTAQEIKFARAAPGLEGPLIDFRAKGSTVALEGTEQLDGRANYRIAVRLASGERQTVWIDAESFLETRYDRTTYGPTGPKGTVSVRYRDYKEVEGLALPSVFEISGAAGTKPDRMVIEKVALNPPIDDREFQGLGDPRERGRPEPAAAPK